MDGQDGKDVFWWLRVGVIRGLDRRADGLCGGRDVRLVVALRKVIRIWR